MQDIDGLPVIQGTGEVLKDFSSTGRERPWSKHKMENMTLYELFKYARGVDESFISEKRLDSFSHCGDFLLYAQGADGMRRLARANFCRVRLCPMCSWRRSLKLFLQVSKIVDAISKDKKARYIFVTLTLRNVKAENLKAAIDQLMNAFKYLVSKSQNFARAKKLKQYLMGYMKALEITYNTKTDTYHPHIHVIFEVKPSYFNHGYISKNGWIEMWRQALKVDYDPSIDVRVIRNSTAKAVAEVAKYPVKVDTVLHIQDKERAARCVITLMRATFHRRLVTYGGDFREYARKLSLDDVENGDLIHVDDENEKVNAVAQVLFTFHADVGLYIC